MAQDLKPAIAACYDAVLDSDRWADALQMLANSLGATSCVIRTTDDSHPFRSDQRNQPAKTPDSKEHLAFRALWLERVDGAPDPHAPRARRLAKRPPYVIVEDEITTREERRQLPYYQEIARPGDRFWWAAVGFRVKSRIWCLSSFRAEKAGRFDLRDAGRLLSAASHLTRIVSCSEQLTAIRGEVSLNALDRIGCAALLLDCRGCVEQYNSQADTLLGSGLLIRHGRIRASDPASDNRLQKMISTATSGWLNPAEPVVILNDGAPWILAETMPLTSFGHDIFAAGKSLLYLTNIAERPVAAETPLRTAFGLTPAEARLASDLSAGDGLGEASRRLGISRETARTQLRAIFDKTGMHSQSQLAALLSQIRNRTTH